jgi:hypothetical protein
MGWASGSYLAEEIWDEFRESIVPEDRQRLAMWLYKRFCNEDADDWDNGLLVKDGEINLEVD